MVKKYATTVTPFVGVWIETLTDDELINSCPVTPFVGVWIETTGNESAPPPSGVTPFVGVWIETWLESMYDHAKAGHTLRGCVD